MFKYFLKKQIRNNSFFFWSLVFPICLMLCFKVAFGNLYEKENTFDPVKMSYLLEDDVMRPVINEVFGTLSSEDGGKLFEMVSVTDREKAEQLLKTGDIHVLFVAKDGAISAVFSEKKTSVDTNIVASFLRSYQVQADKIKTMAELGRFDFSELLSSPDIPTVTEKRNVFNEAPDPYKWYFYSTVVMSILFNILTGIGIVADIQADVSKGAMRIATSSKEKSRIFLAAFFARFCIMTLITALQILIMNVAFGIPLGHHIGLLCLFIFVCELFALSAGEVLGLFFSGPVDTRENKATAVLMTSVFLSGEMIATLPGLLEQHAPWLNAINPATVMNFAFYKLVFYPDLQGFFENIAKIFICSIVFMVISVVIMRRQRYASL